MCQPKIFCKSFFIIQFIVTRRVRNISLIGMLKFVVVRSTQIVSNEVCVLPDILLHRLPIDCKLKSSSVNTSSFSFCFSGFKGMSETPPLKNRRQHFFLHVIGAWFVVKQTTIRSQKFFFSKRLNSFKFKQVTYINKIVVINNKQLIIASGKFDTFLT